MDPKKGEAVKSNEALEATARASYESFAKDDWGRKSLSGHERDRFFLSHGGKQFTDLSLLSGADHQGDGRGCALLDYNGDGRLDIAVANTNKPTLMLFRNELPSLHAVFTLRLRGGQGMNTDAIGARVIVKTPDRTILRELHCGEGNAAQNSKALLIPAGATALTIRWPGGKTTEVPGPFREGSRLTVSPDGMTAWLPAWRKARTGA